MTATTRYTKEAGLDGQEFTAISLVVNCRDQGEVDYYVGELERAAGG